MIPAKRGRVAGQIVDAATFQVLKIDRSLDCGLGLRAGDEAMDKATFALAHGGGPVQ